MDAGELSLAAGGWVDAAVDPDLPGGAGGAAAFADGASGHGVRVRRGTGIVDEVVDERSP